ncbi:MAG: hypothetical protein WC058_08205 [Phycisphaeraceae bacterium]
MMDTAQRQVWRMRWIAVLCAAMMLVACESAPKGRSAAVQAAGQSNAEPRQLSNTDPCAMRLHDLCGSLLEYYADHGRLPGTLGELEPTAELNPVLMLTCPVSDKPYIYDPAGMDAGDGTGRIIVYDAEASHLGMRWAIKIGELRGGKPLVARVVGLPEGFFRERGVVGK